MELFISTEGRCAWSGSLSEPNAAGTDGPLPDLAAARDVVRQKIATGLTEDVEVIIRGGSYPITETIVFDLRDSPPAPYSVAYRAYHDEEPVFTGAVAVKDWKKVDDAPEGIPEEARSKLFSAVGPGHACKTLYQGASRLPRARMRGFTPRLDLSREDWERRREEVDRTVLEFPEGTVKPWSNMGDVELLVRPMWPWVVNYLPLESIDMNNSIAKTKIPATYPMSALRFGTEAGGENCWIENTFEGIDEPGKWALNTETNTIYLWPKEDEPEDILAPRLVELVKIEGDPDSDSPVRGISIDGLIFCHTDRETWEPGDAGLQHDWDLYDKGNAMIRLRGAANCSVANCHLYAAGAGGIRLDLFCQDNRIQHNLIEDIGGTGVLLCGYGPGSRDVNKRNLVTGNHIHHCGRLHWHAPGIFVWQSGENLIANNLIHDLAYNAVVISGVRPSFFVGMENRECERTIRRDETGNPKTWHEILGFLHARNNVFEQNEIHHAMQILADGNAVYVSSCGEGNILRRNYIHDMGAETTAQAAMRTDGWQRGTTITENIVYDCACAVMRKNYNHVENNIFVNARDDIGSIAFRNFPEDEVTQGSRVMRNICFQSSRSAPFYAVRKRLPRVSGVFTKPEDCKCDFNLFYDANDPDSGKRFIEEMQKKALENNSISEDPQLCDPAEGGITPKPGSPAYGLGFKPIDLDNIGLPDEFPKHLRERYRRRRV